ncbi:putative DSB repair complex subunit Ku70 [Aulographum hederae CBS 113979]|uniref:ATP-dependent DNA helicase II subunit 1 n=1 Tax=Aulographum hederae CBS 113979 TaxID=1176131 RepID=A0A6G1H4F0_9PEZI|nr:putative DSB repair complex subunit Ku70 [Aulographum hederae CBS 113979]
MASADNPYLHDGDADDEDDEDLDETGYKTVKDAVIFAIEVSKSMLDPENHRPMSKGDGATLAALKCAYRVMQQRIISHPNDMVGILLFGTEQSKFSSGGDAGSNDLAYPHCYLLTDLDVPEARDVKQLRDLVEDPEEASKLLVPSKEPASMANVLFCVNQTFTTKAPNFSSRRVFLVTDNDNPHPNDKNLRSSAIVRAKDLYDLGVIVDLFPILPGSGYFDQSTFYDDIVYSTNPADPEATAPLSSSSNISGRADGISLLESLMSSINSKITPKRALFSLPFEIGPGLRIGVKGYIPIKRQEPAKSCYVWVGGENEKPQIAFGSTTQMAEDTARVVTKEEIRKAFNFGGEQVLFTPEELAAIRNFGDPVIRIMGFKPLSMLPIWANTRAPYFMYPSETDFIGSTRVFSALQQKLLKDNKMGLAWFIPRRNATPTLAALVPGAEKKGESGEQVVPPGIWIHPLPFADDIRQNPETTVVHAPGDLVALMRKVIGQLQLPKGVYDPLNYPNPALQWFYRILQAIALDEDTPETAEDKTTPKYRQIDKRSGDFTKDWGEQLEEDFQVWQKRQGRGGKRSVDVEDGPPKKRAVKVKGETMEDDEMKTHFERNTISKLTVPVLKEWASGHSIPIHGKKADIVEGVQRYFEKK